jgi:hypothetical protein
LNWEIAAWEPRREGVYRFAVAFENALDLETKLK